MRRLQTVLSFLSLVVVLAALPAHAAVSAASIALDPAVGPPTSTVAVTGQGFGASETVALTMGPFTVGSATTNASGAFSATIAIPKAAKPGDRPVKATGQTSGLTAQATFLVRTDWTQFGFNDDRTRVNPFENVLNPQNARFIGLDWQQQLGSQVFGSSPAVVGGVVYIGSREGTLWAIDANGCGQDLCTTPLWQGDLGAQTLSSPTVANGFVYIGSQTSETNNDGKLDVFSVDGCGQAVCQPLWKGIAGGSSGLESSPAVTADMAYIASYDGFLFAFDAQGCGQALCQPVWKAQLGGPSDSSPTVHDGVVFIGATDGKLYAFDAAGCGQAQCQPLWTGSLGPSSIFSSSPAVSGGLVYISSQKKLGAFAVSGCGQATCQPVWKADAGINFFDGSAAVFRDRLYQPLENEIAVYKASGCGSATCTPLYLDFASGAQAAILSSPAIANGVVYVGRNTSEVLAFKASDCAQSMCFDIWRGRTEDPVVDGSPAVADGKLYIGSADSRFPEEISGRLYVFDLQR